MNDDKKGFLVLDGIEPDIINEHFILLLLWYRIVFMSLSHRVESHFNTCQSTTYYALIQHKVYV